MLLYYVIDNSQLQGRESVGGEGNQKKAILKKIWLSRLEKINEKFFYFAYVQNLWEKKVNNGMMQNNNATPPK